jgi:hypothetical protein
MEGTHPALELTDQSLLIAAVVRLVDDLGGFNTQVIRDVEEVSDLLEEHPLTPLDREVLAHHHDPMVLLRA